jgi:AAA ATPase domain
VQLHEFYVANYRAFRELTRVELRPLTLFFGYNNTGKSSLVRLLPLLAESFKPGARAPLALDSPTLRRASYGDVVHERPGVRPLSIGLSLSDGRGERHHVAADVNWLQEQRLLFVQSLRVTNGEGATTFAATYDPEGPDYPRLQYDLEGVGEPARRELRFEGLVPFEPRARVDRDEDPARLAAGVFDALRGGLGSGNVFWLDALRLPPLRRYPTAGEPPAGLEPDGSNAALFLIYDRLQGDGALVKQVAAWFEEHARLNLEVGSGDEVPLYATPFGGSRRVNVADAGEGIGQVLPVIVALANLHLHWRGQGAVLALEQPEIHLHPDMQGAVASYLARVASADPTCRLLLETHSHDLLLQVQLEILEGRLRPQDVVVHWVRQEGGESHIDTIHFDELAVPQGSWPPRVFSERVDKGRRIVLARLERP